MPKAWLYIGLAVLPEIYSSEHPPGDWWGWVKFLSRLVFQGFFAMKALQSAPKTETPQQVEVVNPPNDPVNATVS